MNTNVNTINNVNLQPVETPQAKKDNDVFSILLAIRYFLPILASVGGLMWAFIPSGSFFYSFGVALMCIGYITALTVCPLKMLAFPFKCIPAGFTICRGFIPYYGIADLVAGLLGTTLGFCFGFLVTLTCPAFFTIKKFLED